MGSPFPHLFRPLRIGGTTLRNRVVSSGHDTVLVRDGRVTDELIAYHEARAAGGAGLVVVQVAGVHESARYTTHVLMATDDACVDGYRRLADAVHRHGTAAVGQLFHPGREILESADGSAPVAWAPSATPNERFSVMPRAMTRTEIREVVEGYGAAARRLRAAGMDGAEIVASHGYLPAQFLNPRVNHREDDYGGTAEGRLRFLRETVDSVREAAGPDFTVGLRISGDELSHDGLSPDLVLETVTRLDEDGRLDYVSVCAGSSATLSGALHIAPPMSQPAGYTAPLAGRVREAVRVPVMVAGRVNQPQEADRIIERGQADACAMTRALICDPELPRKAEAGDTDGIRACIGCNQACIGHFQSGHPISCIQHPETGRERSFATLPPPVRRRKVLIAGGGPAGLKAAAVAASRGHDVTVHERARRVGGQVLLAERLPGRAEFGGAVTNLEREARRAGARIVTESPVDAALLRAERPDALLVATGARPRRPVLELVDDPLVLDSWDVIRGAEVPRAGVVVADWRGDWTGLGVATQLAGQGRRVTLCVTGFGPGEQLQQYVRAAMVADAVRAKVRILPNVRLRGADDDTVYLQHTLTEEPVLVEDVGALVLAQGHEPAPVPVSEDPVEGEPARRARRQDRRLPRAAHGRGSRAGGPDRRGRAVARTPEAASGAGRDAASGAVASCRARHRVLGGPAKFPGITSRTTSISARARAVCRTSASRARVAGGDRRHGRHPGGTARGGHPDPAGPGLGTGRAAVSAAAAPRSG